MVRLSILAALILVATVADSALFGGNNNAQNGSFQLFKVKPRNARDVEVLLRSDAAYDQHTPIYLQNLVIGDYAKVLIEESKVSVFERILKSNGIRFQSKGATLVDKISTAIPQSSSATLPSPDCDCTYQSGGCIIEQGAPEGYACKCSRGFFRCSGRALACAANQACPANCTTLECCKTGGGDCEGYQEEQ